MVVQFTRSGEFCSTNHAPSGAELFTWNEPSANNHGKNPATCIAYVSLQPPVKAPHPIAEGGIYRPYYSFIWWGTDNRDPKKLRKWFNHTVRITFLAKSENISGRGGLDLEVESADGKKLANQMGSGEVIGTTDWKLYFATFHVPANATTFQAGFFMYGSGKFWIDTNSIEYSIVK
jgi:hypothetical protein